VAKRKHANKGRTSTAGPPPTVTLRELRVGAGLTQTDVAVRMGVTQRRVSAVESTPIDALQLRTLLAFVAALGGSTSVVAELVAARDAPARRAVLHMSAP
jgi:transcriptional regulator with XRE-family HTH domain